MSLMPQGVLQRRLNYGDRVDVHWNEHANNCGIRSIQTGCIEAHAKAVVISNPDFRVLKRGALIRGRIVRFRISDAMISDLVRGGKRIWIDTRNRIPMDLNGTNANELDFRYAILAYGIMFGLQQVVT